MESAAAFCLSAGELFGQMRYQSYFLSECFNVELVGIGKGGFLDVYFWHFVDELHDDATQFVGLDWFFSVFVEVVVRFYQFELLVLELQF